MNWFDMSLIIQREGERRIIIELPGVKDPDKAIAVLGKTAMLEFKDEESNYGSPVFRVWKD